MPHAAACTAVAAALTMRTQAQSRGWRLWRHFRYECLMMCAAGQHARLYNLAQGVCKWQRALEAGELQAVTSEAQETAPVVRACAREAGQEDDLQHQTAEETEPETPDETAEAPAEEELGGDERRVPAAAAAAAA